MKHGNFACLASQIWTVTLKKSCHSGFCVLDLSDLHRYKTYYRLTKSNLEELELQYMDCDSFFISFKTKGIIKDLSKSKDFFKFSTSSEKLVLFSFAEEKLFGKFEIETPKSSRNNLFCILRAKSYSFLSSNNRENETKLHGFKKAVRDGIELNDFFNCSWGEGEYKKHVDRHLIRNECLEM